MVENYKEYIIKLAKETGFIRSTLEKVYRLLNVLEWINSRPDLKDLLALKGGTAINTAVFNFPRLSVDIDLDFTQNIKKEQMLKEREKIHNVLVRYLIANNYRINLEKSKNVHALDSIIAEYIDIKGNIDNIKIEINFMDRVHILKTKKMKVNTDVFINNQFIIHCLNPIEIYATKICALLDRTTARDLFDVYTLIKYDLFDKEEKQLLKQCFMLEYIAICGYKLEQMKIENIEKIKRQDIVTKLLPTLRDMNPRKINLDEMKKDVGKYLKDILVIDSNVNEFYNKFQNGIFEPEIIFNDKEIIERVKVHPMILWKLNNK